MRVYFGLVAIAALGLSACSSGEEAQEDMTAEEAVASAGDMERPEPGQYQTKVELIDFQIPGMPEEQMGQMRGMFEGMMAQGSEFCLTQEEADKGWEQMVDELADADCTFQKFDAGGNSLDVAATCTGQDGKPATIKLSGTTGSSKSSLTMEMEQSDSNMPGDGKVRMKMKMDSTRIGDCA